jgi:hypothetical protein
MPSFPDAEKIAPPRQEHKVPPDRPFFPELRKATPVQPRDSQEAGPVFEELEPIEPSPLMPTSYREGLSTSDEEIRPEAGDEDESPRPVLSDRDRRNNILAFIAIVAILLSAMLAAWILYG